MTRSKKFAAKSLLALATLFSTALHAGEVLRPDVIVVATLYADYSWEAVVDEPLHLRSGLLQQNTSELGKYFSPDIAAAIVRDSDCAEKSGEVCALDFLPHWDSQDPTGATVRVFAGKILGEVLAVITHQRSKRKLIYQLKQTNSGWRITDIRSLNSGWRLLGLLKRPSTDQSGPM